MPNQSLLSTTDHLFSAPGDNEWHHWNEVSANKRFREDLLRSIVFELAC
jgi:hypothetical protein